jgi:glucosamine-6-phosphate deaminase
VPASLLQNHDDVTFVVDEAAASELTRNKSPWFTGDCEWTPKMIKKAVVNMALKLKKPVLSLTNSDYNEYGLSDLLVEKGDAYEINLEVFYMLRDTITGWSAGKPNDVIPGHPERSWQYSKRVIIFSRQQDDEIIVRYSHLIPAFHFLSAALLVKQKNPFLTLFCLTKILLLLILPMPKILYQKQSE